MAYIGQSLVEGTRRVYNYTASSGQTTFDAVYQVGVVDVYKNGVLLTPSSYTSSNGQQIVLNSGASAGDTIAIHCHNTFSVTDTVPATGGAFSGAVTVQGAFTSLGIDDNADATAITIDSSERVGIGVAAPATTVHMKAASANLRIEDSDTSAYGQLGVDNAGSIYLQADNANAQSSTNMYFSLDNSEKMRIDSSGNVSIGTTASLGLLTVGNGLTGTKTIALNGSGSSTSVMNLDFRGGGTGNPSGRIGYSSATEKMSFYTGDLASIGERLVIDNSGRVGIGLNDPSSYYAKDLVVKATSEGGITIRADQTTDSNYFMFADGTSGNAAYRGYIGFTHNSPENMQIVSRGYLRIYTGDPTVQNVTIATDGKTGIGTTTPLSRLHVRDSTDISMSANADGQFTVQGNGYSGAIAMNATAMYIYHNSSARNLSFGTNESEQLRITTSGYINALDKGIVASTGTLTGFYSSGNGVGLYNQDAYSSCGSHLEIGTDATKGWASQYINRAWSSGEDERMIAFYVNGTDEGSITSNTSGTTYNTTSDLRLKTDIKPIADGTEKLMAMNPVTHKWKADPNTGETIHGFIAQEMQEIAPEAVHGDPDGEAMMSMDYGRITPILVAALQDAHKKIEALEKRLENMEMK